jgi:hypothetical protein
MKETGNNNWTVYIQMRVFPVTKPPSSTTVGSNKEFSTPAVPGSQLAHLLKGDASFGVLLQKV